MSCQFGLTFLFILDGLFKQCKAFRIICDLEFVEQYTNHLDSCVRTTRQYSEYIYIVYTIHLVQRVSLAWHMYAGPISNF